MTGGHWSWRELLCLQPQLHRDSQMEPSPLGQKQHLWGWMSPMPFLNWFLHILPCWNQQWLHAESLRMFSLIISVKEENPCCPTVWFALQVWSRGPLNVLSPQTGIRLLGLPSFALKTHFSLDARPSALAVLPTDHLLSCCSTCWGRDGLGLQCVLGTDPTSHSSPVSWEADADMSQGNMSPLQKETSGFWKTKKMIRRISSLQCSPAILFYWTVKVRWTLLGFTVPCSNLLYREE